MRRDERLLAACRTAGLPVVLIERNLRGTARPLEYDLIGLDDVRRSRSSSPATCSLSNGRGGDGRGIADQHARQSDAGFVCLPCTPGSAPFPALWSFTERAGVAQADGVLSAGRRINRQRRSNARRRLLQRLHHAIACSTNCSPAAGRCSGKSGVAGFDDLPISNQFAVSITTYSLPAEDLPGAQYESCGSGSPPPPPFGS